MGSLTTSYPLMKTSPVLLLLLLCLAGTSLSCFSLSDLLPGPIFGRSGQAAAWNALSEVCAPGSGGYTWEQITTCKEQFSNADLVIGFPSEEDFNMLDKDDDGVLTEEEFIGC